MSSPAPRASLKATILQLQIVVGAMMAGLAFATVIFFVVAEDKAPPEMPSLSYAAVGLTFVAAFFRMMFPRFYEATQVRKLEGQPPSAVRQTLIRIYQTRAIIATAVLEAAGFLNGIAYLIEHVTLNLAMVVLLLAFMGYGMPSNRHFRKWLVQLQQETFDEEE